MGVTTVHRGHWIPGWWDRLIGVGVTTVHRIPGWWERLIGVGGHHCSQGSLIPFLFLPQMAQRGRPDPRLVGKADWSGGHHCSQGSLIPFLFLPHKWVNVV